MFQIMQNILTMILEVIGCFVFYGIFCKRKEEQKKIHHISVFVIMVANIYVNSYIFIDLFIVKEGMIILISSFIMRFIFETGYKKSLIVSAMYQALLLSIDYTVLLIAVSLFTSINKIDESHAAAGILLVAFAKSILFLVVLLLNRRIGNQQGKILSDKEWIRFLFFPVFSIGTIMAMIVTIGDIENQRAEYIFFVIACGMIVMNVVVFNLLYDVIDRENKKRENEVLKVNITNQMKLYDSISVNFDKQQKLAHEYKNNLLCIDALLMRKEYSELSKYMEKLCKKVDYDIDYINTNNAIVNTILNVKYQETMSKGILFIIKINDLSDLSISDEDIVLILSNMLNNAIEACEKCGDDKRIKLKFTNSDIMTVISVKNTFNGIISKENDMYLSTKDKDRENHGIGIRNIIDTINKYNGDYVIKHENNEFTFTIIIPNKK